MIRSTLSDHDSYPGSYNYGHQKYAFDVLYRLTNGKKLIAMTENGPIPDPDACLQLDAPWSYFMSWSNLVVQQNTEAHLQDVFHNPNVLTLEPPVPDNTFNVTFMLYNKNTLMPLPMTSVTFNSGTAVTDASGKAVFTVNGGTLPYSINKPSYQYESGTITVQSDTTFYFYLTQTLANVKFRLKDGTTPVNLAVVIVNDDSLITNSLGIALFIQLPLSANYSYTISKSGYSGEEGEFYLTGDTTIDITLEVISAMQEIDANESRIIFWPNPVQDVLNFYLSGDITDSYLRITDLTGRNFCNQKIENNTFSILLKDYPPGVYIIHVIHLKMPATQLFIKQ